MVLLPKVKNIFGMEFDLIPGRTDIGNKHVWKTIVFKVGAFITIEIECFPLHMDIF
jgi:hypothetical protein